MNFGAQAGIFVGLIVGSALAAQGAMNARLADHLNGAVPAAVISFTVGLAALVVLNVLVRQPVPAASGLSAAPWWALLGGLAGASVVTGAAFFVPKIGVTTWLAVVIAGQVVAALIIDHFGWLGVETRSADPSRLGGAALLGIGVWLIQRGESGS